MMQTWPLGKREERKKDWMSRISDHCAIRRKLQPGWWEAFKPNHLSEESESLGILIQESHNNIHTTFSNYLGEPLEVRLSCEHNSGSIEQLLSRQSIWLPETKHLSCILSCCLNKKIFKAF
jgi:hypothetical protein